MRPFYLMILVLLLLPVVAVSQPKLDSAFYGEYSPRSRVYLSYGNLIIHENVIKFPELSYSSTYSVLSVSDSLPISDVYYRLHAKRYLIRLDKLVPPDKMHNKMFGTLMVISLDDVDALNVWGTNQHKDYLETILPQYDVWGIYDKLK